MRQVLLAAVALLFLAGCAGANLEPRPVAAALPPAPAPDYRVGDEFVFDNGLIVDTQTVTAVEPTVVVMQSSEIFGTMRQPKAFSNPTEWTGGQYAFINKIDLKNGDLGAIFPLKVGNSAKASASGLFNGRKMEAEAVCDVPRQESIQVKAGRFDTFVVNCIFTHQYGEARFRYWYAPAVGHFVNVMRGTVHMQLVSYKKAGG